MADAAPAALLLSTESATLASQLQILRFATVEPTLPIDAATLDYQIAHVHERHSDDLTRVVLLLRALQRLARVARTNASVWKELVTWLWPERARALLRAHDDAMARNDDAVVVGLSVNIAGLAALDTVRDLLLASDHDADVTSETATERTETETKNVSLPTPSPPLPLAVPLTFNLLFMGRDTTAALSTVAGLAATQVEPSDPTATASAGIAATPPRRCFCLKRICISMQEVYEAQWLDQFTELAALGVALGDFPHLAVDVTKTNAIAIVRNLQLLLATRGPRGQDNDQSTPLVSSIVHRVKLAPRGDNVHARVLAMLISATGHSSTVREVVAFPNTNHEHEGHTFTQWLAYALFSRDARHAIQRFAVESNPRYVFAHQHLLDVLQADDPVAVLFPALAESVAQYTNARLSADRFVLYDPEGDEAAANTADDHTDHVELTNQPHSELRILSRSSAWWSVVLPAWGRAWVHHADATITTVDTTIESNRPRHSIPELSLKVATTDDLAQSLSWLTLVGSGTHTIALAPYDRTPIPVVLDWKKTMGAFPNAKTLCLTRLQVDEPGAFAASVASGSWRLEHLRLTNLSPTASGVDVDTFLAQLVDKRDAATIQSTPTPLQSLTVVATRRDAPKAAIVAASLRLLSVDRHIGSFSLTLVRPRDATDEEDAAMRAAFAAHHGTPLHSRTREKLALLSAATHYDNGLLQQLDSGIFAEIFWFAGWCPRRTVELILKEPRR